MSDHASGKEVGSLLPLLGLAVGHVADHVVAQMQEMDEMIVAEVKQLEKSRTPSEAEEPEAELQGPACAAGWTFP